MRHETLCPVVQCKIQGTSLNDRYKGSARPRFGFCGKGLEASRKMIDVLELRGMHETLCPVVQCKNQGTSLNDRYKGSARPRFGFCGKGLEASRKMIDVLELRGMHETLCPVVQCKNQGTSLNDRYTGSARPRFGFCGKGLEASRKNSEACFAPSNSKVAGFPPPVPTAESAVHSSLRTSLTCTHAHTPARPHANPDHGFNQLSAAPGCGPAD